MNLHAKQKQTHSYFENKLMVYQRGKEGEIN